MTEHDWLTVLSCAGLLGLVALSAVRAPRSPLALPLAILCLVLFGWNFATLAHDVSGLPEWRYIDVGISPFTAPAALHFVLVFVGERRRLGRILLASYAALGALGSVSASALFFEPTRAFAGSEAWALVHIVLMLPVILLAIGLMLRHRGRITDPAEHTRTRLVLAAIVVGTVFAGTELWADLGMPVPRLGALGTFGAGALLAAATFRLELLGRDLSRAAPALAAAAGATAVVFYIAVFRFLGANEGMLVVGTIAVTFVLVVAIVPVAVTIVSQRGRRDRLALLGRMTDQMAHDLKNPLAAVKGAVQFLKEERARGRSIDEHDRFLHLIEGEVDRIGRLLERYRRLGRMEPARARVDPNELVAAVAHAREASAPPGIRVRTELADGLGACMLDADLLSTALDNLVANAFDSMQDGGTVTLRTVSSEGRLAISVADEGPGMDARTREQAFDEFFTTKASGSGLGLPFVRRVAEAHGGGVDVESTIGEGTVVRLYLPLS